MHTYEENCDFEWANLWDNFDHYFLIHVINWFCAALIVRDYYILHFWSIFDEIIELSWQHILPHFGECWWDHVILDVLLSNTTAIIIGVELTKLLGWEQFDWLGRRGKKSILQWDVFRW
jgi:phosphatidylserine synthase 2